MSSTSTAMNNSEESAPVYRDPMWWSPSVEDARMDPSIWIGFIPPAPEDLELRVIGTNRFQPGKVITTCVSYKYIIQHADVLIILQILLPVDVQGICDEEGAGRWVNRIRAIMHGDPIFPELTEHQRVILRDLMIGYRAFAMGKYDRIPTGVWANFFQVLTDGVPRGKIMRADAHVETIVGWLRERYSVGAP